MSWGKTYVETTANDAQKKSNLELSCQQDIDLDVKEISNSLKICYNTSGHYIEVMLENNGNVNITGMRFVIFDSFDNVDIITNNTFSIGPGYVSSKTKINHSLTNDIIQVEFIPKIKPRGSSISELCSKNSLIVEDISACT